MRFRVGPKRLLVAAGAAVVATRLLARSSRLARARRSLRTSSAPSAGAYETFFDRLLAGFAALVTADVAGTLGARPAADVLEIGPGPGALAVRIGRELPGVHLVGLDIDEAMVAWAAARAEREGMAARVRFVTGDVAALPFDDASFDLVVSTFSVHHWSDAGGGFAEIRRVLRPGAKAIVYDLPDAWGRFEAHARPLAAAALAGGWPAPVAARVPWPWPFLSVARRLELVREG